MIVLFVFAFLSGFVTILAPCIWPLLPIVLSSTIAGNSKSHKRPLGITLGVIISFGIFTLSISFLVKAFNIDPNIFRIMAVIVIGFLGLTMLIPYLAARFEVLISRLSSTLGVGLNKGTGFLGGFITGLTLGIVWSPCAGPILATIATLAATGKVSLSVVLVTFFYCIGVGIPLFLFSYGGQQFINKAKGVSKYTGRIQQVFGLIMILTALAIYTNYDTLIETKLLNAIPIFSQSLNKFEGNSLVTDQLNQLKGQENSQSFTNSDLFNANIKATDFVGITKWLNTNKPISIVNLKGKVVLVDFWTYTCINCIRTLPFVTSWYDKYKNDGFVVIGVHTPEFEFEHQTSNVENAIKMYKINYPVAQDNNYATWNSFSNQYWPAEYLIDANGIIRRAEFGEGEYDKTEEAIQTLLREAGKKVNTKLDNLSDQTPTAQLSPETYVGSKRMMYLSKIGTAQNGSQNFAIDKNLQLNTFSFGGDWNISDEDALAQKNSVLDYNFTAGKVYLVLRPDKAPGNVKVLIDGKTIDKSISGKDVVNGLVKVDQDRLYELVNLKGKVENHILELQFDPGISAFAFTFGQ